MVLSKIGKAVASKITSGIDNLESAMFGGKLEKAEFQVYKDTKAGSPYKTIKFFLNPNTIQVSKEVKLDDTPAAQGTSEKKFATTFPVCLKLGELWFDTYD